MILFANAWHVLSAALVFLAGVLVVLGFSKKVRLPQKAGLFLYCWHTLFSMIYLRYSLGAVADATLYYENSLLYQESFKPGTLFVDFFTSLFTRGLGFSYVGAFLVYNIIGSVGLLAFASAVRTVTGGASKYVRGLGWIILLLPSISFWSGAIGKDSISFMSACLFLWGALEARRRAGWLALATLAMLLVRPHMAALMVFAIALGIVFSRGISVPGRIVLALASALAAAFILPFALQYSGLGDIQEAADITDYVEQRQSYNQEGGGAIDISGMSPPLQLFTYLYRPLPFEARGATSFAASIENTGLVLLTLVTGWAFLKRRRNKGAVITNYLTLWFYAGASWLVLAMTTANLGIAARQKWMFAPILLFLALHVLGSASSLKRAGRSVS